MQAPQSLQKDLKKETNNIWVFNDVALTLRARKRDDKENETT